MADYNPANSPIRISDAASMMRRFVSKNERPFTVTILTYNNKMVDEWEEKILKKIANKQGMIAAGSVWEEWQFFHGGKIIPPLIKGLEDGIVCRPSGEMVKYWVEVFSKTSLEDLAKMGPALAGHAWKSLMDEAYIRNSIEKYEAIYKNTDDPLEWRKIARDKPKLWSNAESPSPFWGKEEFQEISQKVATLLRNPVEPST